MKWRKLAFCSVAAALLGALSPNAAYAGTPFGKQFGINEVFQEEMGDKREFENASVQASFLDGFVTLNGYVANIWQEGRLIEIARNINGVKGVINKLDVAAVCVESKDLAKAAALNLFRDETADVYELEVLADNYGRVQISGRADSLQEEQAALEAVKKTKGALFVRSDIAIKSSSGKNGAALARSDEEVEKDLEFALRRRVLIDEDMLETEVNQSLAKIEGNAGSAAEILAVKEVAAEIPGLKEANVVELTIVPRFDRTIVFKIDNLEDVYTDEVLAKAVDTANYYDTRVFSYNLDVQVQDGVVILSGKAKDAEAKKAALENAKNAIGVRGVVDNISVDRYPTEQELLAE